MKQTAVEWFLNEFKKQVWFEENSELDIWINDLIPKAKAMEKEQMRGASCPYVGGWEEGEFEDWYNETYNKDESKTNI
jgi:hypothetical protein